MCDTEKADSLRLGAIVKEISTEERLQNEINFHATRLAELTKMQQILRKNPEFQEFFKLARNF